MEYETKLLAKTNSAMNKYLYEAYWQILSIKNMILIDVSDCSAGYLDWKQINKIKIENVIKVRRNSFLENIRKMENFLHM